MEESFKRDVLAELHSGNGRVLLHDEVEERPGVFSIIPLWENVKEGDILTPREVFQTMVKEGYKIDYGRVAIVSDGLFVVIEGAIPRILMMFMGGIRRTSKHLYQTLFLSYFLGSDSDFLRPQAPTT